MVNLGEAPVNRVDLSPAISTKTVRFRLLEEASWSVTVKLVDSAVMGGTPVISNVSLLTESQGGISGVEATITLPGAAGLPSTLTESISTVYDN
jgi:hypothetical protein